MKLKKAIIVLTLILLLCLVGCNNNSTETSSKNESLSEAEIVSTTSYSYSPWNNKQTDNSGSDESKKNNSVDTNIESLYIEIYGSKTQVKIGEDVIKIIEESKTVESPKIDDLEVTKLGKIYVKEKEEEEIQFGEIYSDAFGKYYLYCLNNPNNAVVELNQGMGDNR